MRTSLAIALAIVLQLSACRSTQSTAVAQQEESIIATRSHVSATSTEVAAVLSSLVAQMDSVEIVVEPSERGAFFGQAYTDSLGTQPAPAPRLRVRAKKITLASHSSAETASATQSQRTDSIARHDHSSAERKCASEAVAGYSPPNLLWLWGFALLVGAVAIAIRWMLKR